MARRCVTSHAERLGQDTYRPTGGAFILTSCQDQAQTERLGMTIACLLNNTVESLGLLFGQGLLSAPWRGAAPPAPFARRVCSPSQSRQLRSALSAMPRIRRSLRDRLDEPY